MNETHQQLLDFIETKTGLSEEDKAAFLKLLKAADRALTISDFKLDRTEKVKRTTAILLEETIEELEQKRAAIEQTNAALNQSLEELKATQAQLIQAEKMASLGELTAGIAHEIQNPLNFVNNFSEVSKELLEEMKEELEAGNLEDVREIADDVISNLEKILHHGKRADSIVKGMLMHSRTSKGEKEATDLNALVDEYLRLAYHGLRAKDKSFNVTLETDYDETIGKVDIIPQEIGRVILNLMTNAFHAATERKNRLQNDFQPKVTIQTKKSAKQILISIADNGGGIPEEISNKIFQPFFTTKPTGQGTGLGLSLSYDIVKAHGGKLHFETQADRGTTFFIELPSST
ncbi:MAG: GHKL domain-containing protein [Gammaproteobacteria bacterium]|nr:MAG: GHKL domain-containing protein [Gammaproteobacteria bacterium]